MLSRKQIVNAIRAGFSFSWPARRSARTWGLHQRSGSRTAIPPTVMLQAWQHLARLHWLWSGESTRSRRYRFPGDGIQYHPLPIPRSANAKSAVSELIVIQSPSARRPGTAGQRHRRERGRHPDSPGGHVRERCEQGAAVPLPRALCGITYRRRNGPCPTPVSAASRALPFPST